jgi:hypothetical protein
MADIENLINHRKFGELLLTRFTHDIAGPISAVANGIDFLMENKNTDDPGGIEIKNQAVDIIEESAKQSMARLQAYRVAYGVLYKADAVTLTSEMTDIFKRYFQKSQTEIRWNASVPREMPANVRQIVTCMILVVSKTLIYGGKISISFGGENKNQIILKAHNHKIKDTSLVEDIILDKKEINPDVENIIYFFTREVCRQSNAGIAFSVSSENEEKHIEFLVTF